MTIMDDGEKFIGSFGDHKYECKLDCGEIEMGYHWWCSINELGTSGVLSFDSLCELKEVRQVINELITKAEESEAEHGKTDD